MVYYLFVLTDQVVGQVLGVGVGVYNPPFGEVLGYLHSDMAYLIQNLICCIKRPK